MDPRTYKTGSRKGGSTDFMFLARPYKSTGRKKRLLWNQGEYPPSTRMIDRSFPLTAEVLMYLTSGILWLHCCALLSKIFSWVLKTNLGISRPTILILEPECIPVGCVPTTGGRGIILLTLFIFLSKKKTPKKKRNKKATPKHQHWRLVKIHELLLVKNGSLDRDLL